MTLITYAFRYITAGGEHSHGPLCKSWAGAVRSLGFVDPTPVDGILINGEPHLFREPVPAMQYLLQHDRIARAMVAALDATASPATAVAFRYLKPLGANRFAWTRWLEMDAEHMGPDGVTRGPPTGCKVEFAYSAPSAFADEGLAVIADERRRHVDVEGWTTEHDDAHTDGQLAMAAASYAIHAGEHEPSDLPEFWPWGAEWWKPGNRERELAKAGSLIAAEIGRLRRTTERTSDGQKKLRIRPQAD